MFEKEQKYFPIKTKTACPLKWGWSTIFLKDGTTSSCHRCSNIKLTKDNFDDFHNLPVKIQERNIMLQGKWPTKENGGTGHCNFCKKHEDVGYTSDRQRHLQIPNMTPVDLYDDATTAVTPSILELYLNNTCNMKCVYCGPHFSSLWEKEIQKYGDVELQGKAIQKKISYDDAQQNYFFKKTLEWLCKNGHKLKRLHILGGEPFYQNEFAMLLDLFGTKKFPNLELNVVSNLMTKENTFKLYTEKIRKLVKNRKIGRYSLTVSIDNWGKEAEYARSGLRLDYFKKLFDYCVKQKWIKMNVNTTVTNLTIKTFPELIDYIKSHNVKKKIEIYGGEVTGNIVPADLLHPRIFGKKFWESHFIEIFNRLPKQTEQDKLILGIYEGILASLPEKQDHGQILKFRQYLDLIDKRRGTNWRSVYPYLDI